MTCTGCAATVEKLLAATPGVSSAKADLENQRATVSMQEHIPTAQLQQALSGTKYKLSEEKQPVSTLPDTEEPVTLKTYLPIFLIFGYITFITWLIQLQNPVFSASEWMSHFMAGFFLVFSFFKLLDVPAFAMSYSSYDVVAKKIYSYGYIYPFIELGLGISFLIPSLHLWSNWITLAVMTVSVLGVIQSMLRKSPFQCACLGTVFKLPLSKITLFEDLLMIFMSALNLFMMKNL